jgi:hypothetical protein
MKKLISEKITELGPDLKYYAFDWDDNIVHMPTKIVLEDDDGDEVMMTTSDFADYRSQIGKSPFNYKGSKVVGFAEDPFRFFGVEGDNQFLEDSLVAKPGPAWDDFREAINNGSIFAIITARGHNPNTIKEGIYNLIQNNYKGINRDELLKNLKKYRDFVGEEDMTDEELIRSYLELNRYNPVSFGNETSATSPEELKVKAMEDFVRYVKSMAALLQKKAYLKRDIANKFIPKEPTIGFSDDDERNVEAMKKHFKGIKEPIKTYTTKGGTKKEY